MTEEQKLIQGVVEHMVDRPEAVRVDRSVDEMGVLLAVHVHPDDMGKVIGKGGDVAKAIRVILNVLGHKRNARFSMKIMEPSDRPADG